MTGWHEGDLWAVSCTLLPPAGGCMAALEGLRTRGDWLSIDDAPRSRRQGMRR